MSSSLLLLKHLTSPETTLFQAPVHVFVLKSLTGSQILTQTARGQCPAGLYGHLGRDFLKMFPPRWLWCNPSFWTKHPCTFLSAIPSTCSVHILLTHSHLECPVRWMRFVLRFALSYICLFYLCVCLFVCVCVCAAESLRVVTQRRETRESHHHRDSGAGSKWQQTRLHPEPVHRHCPRVLHPRYVCDTLQHKSDRQEVSPSVRGSALPKTNLNWLWRKPSTLCFLYNRTIICLARA